MGTEEGCLSLVGVRKTTRYKMLIEYFDKNWNKKEYVSVALGSTNLSA